MSRSGYDDAYCEQFPGSMELWEASVRRAFNGKRGQAFLRDLRDALDAMPEKRLAAHVFAETDPESGACDVCVLEVIARARGITLADLDPEDTLGAPETAAARLGIAQSMARDLLYHNDDFKRYGDADEDAKRWQYMRNFVERLIKKETSQ